MRFFISVCLLFCFAPLASAQEEEKASEAASPQEPITEEPSTLRPLQLGITRKEVRKLWGEPLKCLYVFDIEECTSPDEYDWSKRKGPRILHDVYKRKTVLNVYSVVVDYEPDQTRSAQRADIRVTGVNFDLEKPMPVLPTLKDLPEALELCNSGCAMLGDIRGGIPDVMVFSQPPTLRQRGLADRIMHGWKPSTAEHRRRRLEWLPTVKLRLEEKPGDINRNVHNIAWFERSVQWVEFSVFAPRTYLKSDKKYRFFWEQSLLELGSFKPGPKE